MSAFDFYTNDTVVNIPPQDYLIKGILPEGVNLLAAQPKQGKSIVALDWGLSLSSGLDWMGFESRQVPVLYVLSEARGTLAPRVKAWQIRHGRLPSEITYACGATNLCDTSQVIKDIGLHMMEQGLIIWDTMSRNMVGGDENDFRTLSGVIRTCDFIYDNYHTTSLLVHHSTKEHTVNVAGGKVVASWYRGHSSLLGAIDMGITIEDNELICKASRHDEPFEPIAIPKAKVAGSIINDWNSKKAAYR